MAQKRVAAITKGGDGKAETKPKKAARPARPKRASVPHPWAKEAQLTPHDQQRMNSKMLDVPLSANAADNYKRMAEARNAELARTRRLNAEDELNRMRTGAPDPQRVRYLRERYHGWDAREEFFKIPKPPEMEQESISRLVRAIEGKGKGKG